jgi:hypothetical protein
VSHALAGGRRVLQGSEDGCEGGVWVEVCCVGEVFERGLRGGISSRSRRVACKEEQMYQR